MGVCVILILLLEDTDMNDVKLVLFDLDGTLTDPKMGITNSVMYSLEKRGYTVPRREELFFFIGPPLIDSYIKLLGVDEEEARRLVDTYREYFSVTGLFENEPINGVTDLLKTLKEKGVKLALATSKPKIYADQILKRFGLWEYFDLSVGSFLDGRLTDKAEVIAEVLKQFPDIPKSQIAMVGDRCFDMEGAVKNGILPLGVLCGYGDENELKSAGAARIFGTLPELLDFLVSPKI